MHLFLPLIICCLASVQLLAAATVNVYSSRHYGGDTELYAAFTARTGIKVQVVEAKSGALIARVKAEGAGCPADLLILTDAGNLGQAAAGGLLQDYGSATVNQELPARFQHPDRLWVGLGRRHRIVFYHPERVAEAELPSYLGLADPKWRGRIVVRSSSNIYNQSLLASLIARHGAAKAEEWAAGVVANFARPPQGNDRAQIAAVAAGEADLAIANHYYYAKMLHSDDAAQVAAAKAVQPHFPAQGDGQPGAHTNITGAGIPAHAPHPEAAQKLLAFLTSPEGQAIFVKASAEYPVHPAVEPPHAIFPDFRADELAVSELAEHNAEAVKIFDRVGWR